MLAIYIECKTVLSKRRMVVLRSACCRERGEKTEEREVRRSKRVFSTQREDPKLSTDFWGRRAGWDALATKKGKGAAWK
jgi:hypothetical protein